MDFTNVDRFFSGNCFSVESVGFYPYILKDLFESNQFENILDSNILTPYIPEHADIPGIVDPRCKQSAPNGIPRHPAYVRSARINQIFNYIGFIKRTRRKDYAHYLPALFRELNRFIRVMEEIVYTPAFCLSTDIMDELNDGLIHFFEAYQNRKHWHTADWIEEIWKYQKIYLERIDMFLKTLEVTGQVFDLKAEPLFRKIVAFCEKKFSENTEDPPSHTDICFVANCCTKAAIDNESKTIWSGDRHIALILQSLYRSPDLRELFPQVYLRASYLPFRFDQIFPPSHQD